MRNLVLDTKIKVVGSQMIIFFITERAKEFARKRNIRRESREGYLMQSLSVSHLQEVKNLMANNQFSIDLR